MKKIFKFLLLFIIVIIFILFCINLYVKESTKGRIVDINNDFGDIDCILVLGAGIRDNRPSLMLEDRLMTGISLYNNKVSNKLLMSGDHGNINYDEVNIMKKYAMDMGIISSDIFMDHAGFSTYDSIYRAKYIFGVKRVVIVTQKYHLYRALYIARSIGIDAYGVDTNSNKYMGDTYRNIRESIARIKDFVKCIFKPKSKYLGELIDFKGDGDITNDKK